MIALKPNPRLAITCPECGATVKYTSDDFTIAGMHAYADCTCSNCGLQFYQMLPVSHTVDKSLAIVKNSWKIYNGGIDKSWLTEIVSKSFPFVKEDVIIHKTVFKEQKDIVVLNTLDFLYGHSLLKLYNAQYHLDHNRNLGLILIIPKAFEWMIPKGCAEVWIVDLNLKDLIRNYEAIAKFISKELQRFDTVFLSRAYSHPNYTAVNIERFTGIPPFQLDDFYTAPMCITFVLREDRWWFSSRADYWFYRISRKLNTMSFASWLLSRRQNQLVKRTISQILKRMPHVKFNIVGLGKTGSFEGIANDLRSLRLDSSVEKHWCATYSKSHLVIGIHGSNMLLPTAFAPGCVEILPEDRFGNIVQDISVRYSDRRQLFFYRFADQYAGPRNIAIKALSIIKDYKIYKANMCENIYENNP